MNFPITVYGEKIDTTQYDFLPVPEYIQYKTGWDHKSTTDTPYSQDLRQIAARLKLTIPFQKVITLDQGHSFCNVCGQRYAGANPGGCDRIIYKTKARNQYHFEYASRWHKDSRTERCGGSCDWDLQKEFYSQSRFFGFVQELSGISHDNFDEFSESVPADIRDAVRTKITTARLQALEIRVSNALMQIASKMNQAGQMLQF